MPYAITLDRLIKESGMTAKDIAERCKDFGVDVTPSYISMLRNPDKKRVASDEISIALAKVLGKPDDYMVIERFSDEAPEQFGNAIKNFYKVTYQIAIKMTGAQLPPFEDIVDKLPMAEMIYSLANTNIDSALDTIPSNGITSDSISLNLLPELRVSDDGLAPIIKQGDYVKVGAATSYSDGDIIALARGNDAICRQYRKIDNKPYLVAYNIEYPNLVFDENEIAIGIVKNLIRAI